MSGDWQRTQTSDGEAHARRHLGQRAVLEITRTFANSRRLISTRTVHSKDRTLKNCSQACSSGRMTFVAEQNHIAHALGVPPTNVNYPIDATFEKSAHMAHFQLGSFLIGLVSNWARF